MNRYAPHVLIGLGLTLALLGMTGAACFVFMGFGSSFAASTQEMGDRVFDQMVMQLLGCAVGVVSGIAMLVAGMVMFRKRSNTPLTP